MVSCSVAMKTFFLEIVMSSF